MKSRQRLLELAIAWSVPVLNVFRRPPPWRHPAPLLAQFDEASFGHAIFLFLTERNIGFLPKYEIHDAYHVLLGYGTTVTDELRLQAFMAGNRNSTFAGAVLYRIGWLLLPSLRIALEREYRRGAIAMPLHGVELEPLLTEPLAAVQMALGLTESVSRRRRNKWSTR